MLPETSSSDAPEPPSSQVEHEAPKTAAEDDSNTMDSPIISEITPSPAAAMDDEESALKKLTETVRDQDDLERDISIQANKALTEVEDKRDRKRIERAEATLARLEGQKRQQQQKLQGPAGRTRRQQLRTEIARIEDEISVCRKDVGDFERRIAERNLSSVEGEQTTTRNEGRRLPDETQREYLIRTGKITPFSNTGGVQDEQATGDLAAAIVDAEDEGVVKQMEKKGGEGPRSHRNLRLPGFADAPISAVESEFSLRPRKRRKVVGAHGGSDDEFTPSTSVLAAGSHEAVDDDDSEDRDMTDLTPSKSKRKRAKRAAIVTSAGKNDDLSAIDDGDEQVYQTRLKDWVTRRSRARQRRRQDQGLLPETKSNEKEWFRPSPEEPDHHFENGLKLPGDIFPSLFEYQKTCVRWLAELYAQQVGGIIGDEMGLGKTVQLISFVAALHYSKMLDKPVIVVAPATVLRQWVKEFHLWWPPLRVSILHSSGSGMFNVDDEDEFEQDDDRWDEHAARRSSKAARDLVNRVVKHGHVLVTTYAGLQTYRDVLIPVDWGYAVLDEGHKIRNPNAAITISCKELRTANRVILSGTPMQNNLTELWSLFDFIYPMRLGTLLAFRNQFEIPIKLGGYANATNLQVMTAQKCAETLKDTISPYLLQRMKVDVAADLPKKSEQVLFCKLSEPQREAYELFLKSDDMNAILNRTRQSLYGIDILRKICNHPDLLDPRLRHEPGNKWGSASKSGKMQVVKSLLPMWKRLGHKTLLFCQGVQMLDIIEYFVRRQQDIRYIRMDGKTPVKERQSMVDQFNNDPGLDVFLLTTKVGGLGVNLTGANRVIIFDPDWNPSTDVQARERAWRLGQKKDVTIYRLMTAGTIEEKIYHRQIFKQFLSNKVLKDPKQRTTFNLQDLHNLFSLSSYDEGTTETGEMFRDSEVKSLMTAGPTEVMVPGHDVGPVKVAQTQMTSVMKDERVIDERHGEQIDGDLDRIIGIAGIEPYQSSSTPPPNAEDRLIEGIFARSVHSALEHDTIINSRGTVAADRSMLQREANRVAAQAAQALRQAAGEARSVPIGTVTWTGAVGEAGRPNNLRRGRGGPSSAAILNRVADRQSNNAIFAPAATSLRASDFERLVPEFITRHGGKVPSKALVDHFNKFCGTTRAADEFKTALNRVAVMEKGGMRMRGIWKLKGSG